ncbi:MAG: V-type ATP synthase subunit F [Candidatus Saliniplasma sp.]
MRKKVVVIGKEAMTLGFSLAGADDSYTPEDEYQTVKLLDRLIESPDVGVVLLSERIAEDIRDEMDRISEEKELYPVIIEIPDKKGPLEDKEDPLNKKIRRAVGIDITSEEV